MAGDSDPNTQHDLDASGHEAERRLVREVLLGRPAALERFATLLAAVPAIVAVHRRHSGLPIQEQELPDLVQDCLSLIWRKLPDYEGRASLSTWMFRLCTYELCNGFRRLTRLRRVQPLGAEMAETLVTSERPIGQRVLLDLDLRAGLQQLRPVERDIIELRHFEGCTMEEVAGRLGSKLSQVKTIYYRALQRLHDYLDRRDFGDREP